MQFENTHDDANLLKKTQTLAIRLFSCLSYEQTVALFSRVFSHFL